MGKDRGSFKKSVGGCCQNCWYLSMRCDRVSCTKYGHPLNADECDDYRENKRFCGCGQRLYFREVVMPNPLKRSAPGFPSGHYFCEDCGTIVRSATADGKYAEWVEDLIQRYPKNPYNSEVRERESKTL